VTADNGNFTNLTSLGNSTLGNVTAGNITATTLNVTGQTILSGLNNTGPLNNIGNLTNTGNTTLTGTTNINGVLNMSNATVIGLNIDPGSLAADRILGDPTAPLSSNGVTGTNDVVNGTGGVITYKQGLTKTIAANTTIGDRLAGAQYQTQVAGNEFIDGNLYVNGDTAFVGTHSATSTVDASSNLASSQLAGKTTGVIGQTGITTTAPVTDLVTNTTKVESVASTTLTNGVGTTNGLQVFEDRTRLTGGGETAGAPSSSITLNSTGTTLLGGAPGTLASNGVTGITATNPGASTGSGGIEVLSTPATVAPNTTIGDRLNGVTYQDKVSGNTLVDGNLYVNGDTAFVGKTGATSTVVGDLGTSKLEGATAGVTGQTGVVVKGAPVVDPVTGAVAPAPESVASTTLTNGLGQTNGLKVYEDRTELSGGTQQPAKLTMNDNGATFSNSTGGPAKVTGVADGTTKYDAVNYGQLQDLSGDMNNIAERAYSGISQASAMAAIPAPMAGHHYSVGMGSGFYAGQQAIAFGGKADVGEHIRLSAAMGSGFGSTSQMSANAGAGFSW
ncbi:MAG: YadA domain-containing protein, partial [Methylococcaceae bacterium NSP1-2]